MKLSLEQLAELPSPFYRVAVKALVFNDNHELLLAQNSEGTWELPGGGWEHDETLEECVARELLEEARVEVTSVGPVQFVFDGESDHGWRVLRIVVTATLAAHDVAPGEGMLAARYVSKTEFLQTEFHVTDSKVANYVDQIWPIS